MEFPTFVNMGRVNLLDLPEITARSSVLARQPPLETNKIYEGKNPQIRYREIFVDVHDSHIKGYRVSDMGRADDCPGRQTLGYEVFSVEEVKELSQQGSRP